MCFIILRWEIQFCRGTNSEEVACKGEGSDKLVHCDDPEPSSEKTDVNEQGRSFFLLGYVLYRLYNSITLSLENKYF